MALAYLAPPLRPSVDSNRTNETESFPGSFRLKHFFDSKSDPHRTRNDSQNTEILSILQVTFFKSRLTHSASLLIGTDPTSDYCRSGFEIHYLLSTCSIIVLFVDWVVSSGYNSMRYLPYPVLLYKLLVVY
jgi:hypothetical protein